jgi:hypothetical protein
MHHTHRRRIVFSCRFLHIPPLSYFPHSSPASDPPFSQPYSLTVRRADAQAVQDRPRQERRQHLGRQWQPAAGQQGAARFAACRPRAAPAPGLGRSPAPRLRVRLVSRPAAWPLARRIRESLTVYRRTEVHSSTSDGGSTSESSTEGASMCNPAQAGATPVAAGAAPFLPAPPSENEPFRPLSLD